MAGGWRLRSAPRFLYRPCETILYIPRFGEEEAEEGSQGKKNAGQSEGNTFPCRRAGRGRLPRDYATRLAGLLSSPISGTRMVTTSPGCSAADSGTMMPVPVESTDAAGTALARSR